eukprot:CAMPEP_0206608946 /NCGR_PEP_ID=MMETSP0325_2-20121206/53402_1 /ASSEMBLY_ACC=CAM_ASM_000347 /TAXON_ID=2866 /ORGANISM="Crypthecodinium cohnii, Strain Seligo" /LENGTH=40 /DNA_ID= /DNA_START= /DNA_END= /DNA_ORIENTATION=
MSIWREDDQRCVIIRTNVNSKHDHSRVTAHGNNLEANQLR